MRSFSALIFPRLFFIAILKTSLVSIIIL
jgi:hypothetical protein